MNNDGVLGLAFIVAEFGHAKTPYAQFKIVNDRALIGWHVKAITILLGTARISWDEVKLDAH